MPNGTQAPPTTPPAGGVDTVDTLAAKIKQQFPDYNSWDNHQLVSQVIQKHPEYQNWLSTNELQKLGATPVPQGNRFDQLATGFTKGGLETIQGAQKLLNKVWMPSDKQMPILGEGIDTAPHGGWETAGNLVENIGEFAAGDEALKGLVKFGQLANNAPKLLALAERYPKTLKVLQGAIVGGTQGAVKGAASDQAAEGAKGGAIGGSGGAYLGELIGPGAKALGRMLGLGGWTGEEALVKAARPSVTEDAKFREAIQTAAPRIIQAAKNTAIKSMGNFEDLLHDAANSIRTNEFGPMIQQNASATVQAGSIRSKILAKITPQMRQYAPEDVEELRQFAARFNDMPLQKAEQDLQYFNAQLKKFYKMNPVERAANLKINATMTKYEAAADALRDSIYSKIKAINPDAVPEALQKQYGALKDLERVVGKRATVADRAAPLNLSEVIGLISGAMEGVGAIAAGHPMLAAGAAVPYLAAKVAKRANAPETLTRLGVKALAREATPSTIIAPAKTAAGRFLGAAGALGGRTFTTGGETPEQPSNTQPQ